MTRPDEAAEFEALAAKHESLAKAMSSVLGGPGTRETMLPRVLESRLIARACRYYAAAARQEAGPAGWKLVPIEPNAQMIDHGSDAVFDQYSASDWDDAKEVAEEIDPAQIYRAMLAASPAAPAVGAGGDAIWNEAIEAAAKYHDDELGTLDDQIERNNEYRKRTGSLDNGANEYCRALQITHRLSAEGIRRLRRAAPTGVARRLKEGSTHEWETIAPASDGRQPIETAPKDGTWILLHGGKPNWDFYAGGETFPPVMPAFWITESHWVNDPDGGHTEDGYWATSYWDGDWRSEYLNPTLWSPLPAPPEPAGGA